MDNLSYQSTVDMDFRIFRAYESRINKYFLETPDENLISKDEMGQLWSSLACYSKQLRISLQVEV